MYDFTNLSLIVAVTIGLSEGAKSLGLKVKYVPILNLLLGIAGGIVYVNPGDIKTGIFTGIIIGLTSSGLYSGVKNVSENFK